MLHQEKVRASLDSLKARLAVPGAMDRGELLIELEKIDELATEWIRDTQRGIGRLLTPPLGSNFEPAPREMDGAAMQRLVVEIAAAQVFHRDHQIVVHRLYDYEAEGDRAITHAVGDLVPLVQKLALPEAEDAEVQSRAKAALVRLRTPRLQEALKEVDGEPPSFIFRRPTMLFAGGAPLGWVIEARGPGRRERAGQVVEVTRRDGEIVRVLLGDPIGRDSVCEGDDGAYYTMARV